MKNRLVSRSPWCRALGPVLIFFAAVVLPSCGEDNASGLPPVQRAAIAVAVDPNPVIGVQNTLTLGVSAAYVVVIAELAGLGGEVLSITSTVFDPLTGFQVGLTFFDSASLEVFEGGARIEPRGVLEVSQTTAYILTNEAGQPDGRIDADLTVSVQFRDDRGSVIVQSILVRIVPPPTPEA